MIRDNNYFKTLKKWNTSLESRYKKIDETRNYFLEEIKYNELKSKKHKKTCKASNYVEHLLILAFTIIGFSICLSKLRALQLD